MTQVAMSPRICLFTHELCTAFVQVHEELQMLRGNIRVVCRARPGAEQSVLAFPLPGAITVYPPDRAIKEFEFNACFGPESSQVGQLSQRSQRPGRFLSVHYCLACVQMHFQIILSTAYACALKGAIFVCSAGGCVGACGTSDQVVC